MNRITNQYHLLMNFEGEPVYEFIEEDHKYYYQFKKTAILDEKRQFDLNSLNANEIIISPGIIYEKVNKNKLFNYKLFQWRKKHDGDK